MPYPEAPSWMATFVPDDVLGLALPLICNVAACPKAAVTASAARKLMGRAHMLVLAGDDGQAWPLVREAMPLLEQAIVQCRDGYAAVRLRNYLPLVRDLLQPQTTRTQP